MVRVGQFVAPRVLAAEAFLFSRPQCFHLHVTVDAEMDRVPLASAARVSSGGSGLDHFCFRVKAEVIRASP